MIDAYYSRQEVSNSDLSALKKGTIPDAQLIEMERAFRFGRLVDAIITEPAVVDFYQYMIADEQYSKEEFIQARHMQQSFLKDPICMAILNQSIMQHIMILHGKDFNYQGKAFALNVRCKWDLWMKSVGWGCDIKSTTAVSQKQFEEAARFFDYDRQRAWYMDIAGSNKDMLIGISKKNYLVFKIPITRGDRTYNSGREKYEDLAYQYWLQNH